MSAPIGRLVEFAATGAFDRALLASGQVREVKELAEGRFEFIVGEDKLSGEDIDELLERLWDLITPLREADIFRPEVAVLRIVQYIGPSEGTPGLGVPEKWVKFLASVNGFLDIDQYVISEGSESDG